MGSLSGMPRFAAPCLGHPCFTMTDFFEITVDRSRLDSSKVRTMRNSMARDLESQGLMCSDEMTAVEFVCFS